MAQLYGRFEFEKEILEVLSSKYLKSGNEDEIQNWLGLLLELDEMIMCKNGDEMIDVFIQVLTDENNIGMMGIGLFLQYVNGLSDAEIKSHLESIQIILQIYDKWKHLFVEKVYSEFQREHTLEGQSRVELAAFCRYILEN